MHITILALGSSGDILPYAVLGRGLKAAGHQVRLITFENYSALVAEQELDFYPIRGNAQALVANAGADTLALVRSFSSLAEGYARDLSAPHLGETDLILNQLPVGLYGFDLAEKYNIPMALAAVIPLTRTDAFPLMGFPKIPVPGYNKTTYFIGGMMGWLIFRGVINRWRKHTLKLPPQPLTGYLEKLGSCQVPMINGFSQHVVPRPADWEDHIYTTGYWFPKDERWTPPADLLAFLEAGSPPVFIGFGSMPVKNPERTTHIILEALRQSGQRGILHMGWGGLGNQTLPDYVVRIDYAPYHWLFPRMAMVIHHGGSGTTAFGLHSGIPSCVVSFVFDQHFWGQRIAKLGAGPAPIRYRRLTVETLREAMLLGVNNMEMRQAAAAIGAKIRAENGVGNAIHVIEQILQNDR